jgi:hypothetical protein
LLLLLHQHSVTLTVWYISDYNTSWHHHSRCPYEDIMHLLCQIIGLHCYYYNNKLFLLLHITYLNTTHRDTILSDAIMGITCNRYITCYNFCSTVTTIICYCYYILHICLQHTGHHVSIFKYTCSHMLMQYGPMLWLKGADVVHYFNDKWILLNWVFNFLLACIRHNDILHKIDATGFRIFVSPDFYVSHYGFSYNWTTVIHLSIYY